MDDHNRRTVRLGRSFAGSIASRLDAHPGTMERKKLDEERRIIELARKVLSKKEPDACAVSFLTQAVEFHTKLHGFSKAIYDELFKLNEARGSPEVVEVPRKALPEVGSKLELSRYLMKV